MFRRLPIAVAVVALVTLMAAPGAYAERGGMDRPFRATMVGEAYFGILADARPDCDPELTTFTDSPGRATHMGKITMSSSHCSMSEAYMDGELTIAAANGDELLGVYDYDPYDETNRIPVTISGGSGRFERASGSLTMAYSVEPQFTTDCKTDPFCIDVDPSDEKLFLDIAVPWPWSATLTGTITY